MLATLIAQAAQAAQPTIDADTGTIAGLSSFGLTGVILFLFFYTYVPSQDKRFAAKDQQITDIIDKFDRRIDSMQADFKAALNVVAEHCKDEMKFMVRNLKSPRRLLDGDGDAD